MIQSSFRSNNSGKSGMISNEFKFSVTDNTIAEQLIAVRANMWN